MLQAQYKYNALGQQVWRKLHPSGQIIHSLFDLEGNRIAEYDYAGGSSTLIREYIWMNGLPVAVVENGVVYYVRTDHIGRPVFATDSAGAKVWEAAYYPFGEVLTHIGANINLRFPGQWFQSESGLHQNWMRDYDPTTGRYMQADPLGLVDGASVYGYAGQNPGRYVDPTGELLKPDGGRSIGFGISPDYWSKYAARRAAAAAAAAAANQGQNAQDDAESEGNDECETCPPCRPFPKGSILYRFDTGHTHYPAGDPHLNLLEVVQDPKSCNCYYNRNTPFGQAIDPPAHPDWIEYFGNYAPPLSP